MADILHFATADSRRDADRARDLTILLSAAAAIIALMVGIVGMSGSHEATTNEVGSMIAIPL
jgi:hypothetical protein